MKNDWSANRKEALGSLFYILPEKEKNKQTHQQTKSKINKYIHKKTKNKNKAKQHKQTKNERKESKMEIKSKMGEMAEGW